VKFFFLFIALPEYCIFVPKLPCDSHFSFKHHKNASESRWLSGKKGMRFCRNTSCSTKLTTIVAQQQSNEVLTVFNENENSRREVKSEK